jgi:hypothetical protein
MATSTARSATLTSQRPKRTIRISKSHRASSTDRPSCVFAAQSPRADDCDSSCAELPRWHRHGPAIVQKADARYWGCWGCASKLAGAAPPSLPGLRLQACQRCRPAGPAPRNILATDGGRVCVPRPTCTWQGSCWHLATYQWRTPSDSMPTAAKAQHTFSPQLFCLSKYKN